MIELTIYGRGGRGGVTLAKLIATTYFLRGKHVQAFGVYGAERSGAPVQAFMRADDEEITNHNQIQEPDHVIVVEETLLGPHVLSGLKPDGWIIINTHEPPERYAEALPGRRVATVDANAIAVAHGLGTKTVPIVNTALLGAAGKLLDLEFADVEAALAEMKFGGANVTVARKAYDAVVGQRLTGKVQPSQPRAANGHVVGILDDEVGGMPVIRTGTWASRRPSRHELTPACNNGCPAGNDVRGFVQAVAQHKDYDAALAIILKTSPFPGICGRVCPAPCMEACNHREHESRSMFAISSATSPITLSGPNRPAPPATSASPSSAPARRPERHLPPRRLGYHVTLLEAGDEIGGVMRTGIPFIPPPPPRARPPKSASSSARRPKPGLSSTSTAPRC
jgi:2-oxoacid:acceptor oxidoreductase gamma subunit (pyruvate/2-ketoisovalerate family)